MMTHWRTKPAAAAAGHAGATGSGPVSDFRPQVFVHLEFGVSWSSRHPNSHTITYHSRALRNRLSNHPREGPFPNTNLAVHPGAAALPMQSRQLSLREGALQQHQRRDERHDVWEYVERQRAWHDQQQHQQQQRQHQHQHQHQHQQHEEHERQHRPRHPRHHQSSQHLKPQARMAPVEEERASRSSRSSHERGHSAPPLSSGGPWDITTGDGSGIPHLAGTRRYEEAVDVSENFGGTATATSANRRPAPQIWKELPEVPSRYRLGEASMPWATDMYEPDADPDDERLRPRSQPESGDSSSFHQYRRRSQQDLAVDRSAVLPFTNNPIVVPIQASETGPRRSRDVDPQRWRDLESLSAAMVTVDNGFENQWWNQGGRETTITRLSPTSPAPPIWPAGMSASALPVIQPPADDNTQQQQSADIDPPPRRMRTAPLGWAIASPNPPALTRAATDNVVSAMTPSSASGLAFPVRSALVSPVSAGDDGYDFLPRAVASPTPSFRGVNRSLSTRSEELFMSGARYA